MDYSVHSGTCIYAMYEKEFDTNKINGIMLATDACMMCIELLLQLSILHI